MNLIKIIHSFPGCSRVWFYSDVLACNTRVFVLVFSLALTLRKPLLEFCKTVMNILSRGLDAINESRKKKKKHSISWGLIFSLILFFAFISIDKWKKGLQRSHTARLVFCVFLMCLFIFFVFTLLSDAKRDVLRFATGAFACAVGRSEPLESDWKDLFPALFNYVSLDAEARLPSKQGEKERRGRRGQSSTVTSWDVNRFGGLAPRPPTLKRVLRSSSSVLAASTRGYYIQPNEV